LISLPIRLILAPSAMSKYYHPPRLMAYLEGLANAWGIGTPAVVDEEKLAQETNIQMVTLGQARDTALPDPVSPRPLQLEIPGVHRPSAEI
jgi:hypothetical protein